MNSIYIALTFSVVSLIASLPLSMIVKKFFSLQNEWIVFGIREISEFFIKTWQMIAFIAILFSGAVLFSFEKYTLAGSVWSILFSMTTVFLIKTSMSSKRTLENKMSEKIESKHKHVLIYIYKTPKWKHLIIVTIGIFMSISMLFWVPSFLNNDTKIMWTVIFSSTLSISGILAIYYQFILLHIKLLAKKYKLKELNDFEKDIKKVEEKLKEKKWIDSKKENDFFIALCKSNYKKS